MHIKYCLAVIISFFFLNDSSATTIWKKLQPRPNVNERVAVLCSETSMRCARSCNMYIQCSSSLLEGLTNNRPSAPDPPQSAPQSPSPAMIPPGRQVCKNGDIGVPAGVVTDPLNRVISQLCTEMSSVCAKSCQTYIDQCSSPNDSPFQTPLPIQDEAQPTGTPIILGTPSSSVGQPQQPPPQTNGCSGQGKSCVDHRDCCAYLYCKRFMHNTGAEAKLGSCAPDPARIR